MLPLALLPKFPVYRVMPCRRTLSAHRFVRPAQYPTSALGSVNGKWCGRRRILQSSPYSRCISSSSVPYVLSFKDTNDERIEEAVDELQERRLQE